MILRSLSIPFACRLGATTALVVVGSLVGCGPSATRTQTRTPAANRSRSAPNALGGRMGFSSSPNPRFHLALDVWRSDGCSQTFVSTRTRGRITVVASRFGVSWLTVELNVHQSSGPTRRPSSGVSRRSRRRWQRVYRWTGKAGFMGPSAQLHLKPLGTGCSHRDIAGYVGGGCRGTVPALVVECTPARLADGPPQIRLRKPTSGGASVPTGPKRRQYLRCKVEVAGHRDRAGLPHDLGFLSGPLLLSRGGRRELVLQSYFDAGQIKGERRRPRAR